MRRTVKWVSGAAVLGVLVVTVINLVMIFSVRDRVTTVRKATHAQAAIVLGALVYADGRMSPMLADRVTDGLDLYRSGAVDSIIVSGDHRSWAYNEVFAMRDALIRGGVPPERIFTDHAGFDTWSTMRRAREVFGVDSAIVVTQGFHLPRALYLARAAGLDAHGVASDLHDYGTKGRDSAVREIAARVKGFGSATVKPPVLLGPSIPITGDGRVSWGPEHRPG